MQEKIEGVGTIVGLLVFFLISICLTTLCCQYYQRKRKLNKSQKNHQRNIGDDIEDGTPSAPNLPIAATSTHARRPYLCLSTCRCGNLRWPSYHYWVWFQPRLRHQTAASLTTRPAATMMSTRILTVPRGALRGVHTPAEITPRSNCSEITPRLPRD